MPGPKISPSPLTEAVSQDIVEATDTSYATREVKEALFNITSDLLSMNDHTDIFGSLDSDPYTPSLRTLYKRLTAGQPTPSPLRAQVNEGLVNETVLRKPKQNLTARPLEDFEDLYYALLARIKDLHGNLTTRVNNGFNSPSTLLFENGVSISHFENYLVQSWTTLNDASLVKALDNAIRRSRAEQLHQFVTAQYNAGDITKEDMEDLFGDLALSDSFNEIEGLSWIGGWSAAMINGWLEEKYRDIFKAEKAEVEKRLRWQNKKKRMYIGIAERKERHRQVGAQWKQSNMIQETQAENEQKKAMQTQAQQNVQGGILEESVLQSAQQNQTHHPDVHMMMQIQAQLQEQGSTLKGNTFDGYTIQSRGDSVQRYVPEGNTLQGYTPQGNTLQGYTLQGLTLHGNMLQRSPLQGDTLQGSTPQGIYPLGVAIQQHHHHNVYQQGRQQREQRVSQYSQYLRGMASDDARMLVLQTNQNAQQTLHGNQHQDQEDRARDADMDMCMGWYGV